MGIHRECVNQYGQSPARCYVEGSTHEKRKCQEYCSADQQCSAYQITGEHGGACVVYTDNACPNGLERQPGGSSPVVQSRTDHGADGWTCHLKKVGMPQPTPTPTRKPKRGNKKKTRKRKKKSSRKRKRKASRRSRRKRRSR